MARFYMAEKILFWYENAKVAIIPNLQVSLMGFWKFFLWVAGIFLEGWEAALATGFVIGI